MLHLCFWGCCLQYGPTEILEIMSALILTAISTNGSIIRGGTLSPFLVCLRACSEVRCAIESFIGCGFSPRNSHMKPI